MSSLLTTIREFFGPPDPRSEREIEDDIDAEFAFHVEQIEAELIEQCVPPEHAPELARARFGNQAKLKQRCKRIALEERIMLQRMNLALVIVVLLAVGVVAVQSILSQRANHEALSAINERLEQVSVALATVPSAAETARVLVEGEVDRPGWYPINLDGATYLDDVIQQAGGIEPYHEVRRIRPTLDGRRSVSQTYTPDELFSDRAQRVVLRPDDEIRVFTPQDRPRSPSLVPRHAPESGKWQQVDRDGRPIPNGYMLSVLGSDDVRNLQRVPIGTLNLPDHEADLTLQFQQTSRQLRIDDHTGYRSNGRWQMDDGVLALNVRPAVEAIIEPLLFRHVDDLDNDAVKAAVGDDGTDARILIDGDIERPGWYPITLDRATLVHEVLKRVNVNERQWVHHRQAGETHSRHDLAEIYLDDDPLRTVIRPGDEISIADVVTRTARNNFAARHADRFLFAYEWKQIDEHGDPVDGGWQLRFVPSEFGPRPFSAMSVIDPVQGAAYTIPIGGTTGYSLIVPDGPDQRRKVSVRWSFNVETITLTITQLTERGNVYWSEDEYQAILEQTGLSEELIFARFPHE